MSGARARMRALRARRKRGRFVLRMEIERAELAEFLFDNGFLADWRIEDNDTLADALRRLIVTGNGLPVRDPVN